MKKNVVKRRISIEEHKRWLRATRILARIKGLEKKIKEKIKEEMEDESSFVFVGEKNYPNVWFASSLSQHIEPRKMIEMRYEEVLERLLNGVMIKGEKEKMEEIALTTKPVDVEVKLRKLPKIRFFLSHLHRPLSPISEAERIRIVDNPKIPKRVDEIIEEKIKAEEAVDLLFGEVDEYYIQKIFSFGLLGIKKRVIPTRWSITAVDDILARKMLEKVRDYKEIENYEVYWNERFYNRFVILFIPGKWEFENFESWYKGTTWGAKEDIFITEEYEPHYGRKDYADSQAGGYYASRFAIVKFLYERRKQARVVAFREVYFGYNIPLGVWQVRENVKEALEKPPRKFSSLEEALDFAFSLLKIRREEYLKRSRILRQGRISKWL